MPKAVIALGANMGSPREQLQMAVDSFNRLPGTKVVDCSRLYVTKPVGYDNQPDFLNCPFGRDKALPGDPVGGGTGHGGRRGTDTRRPKRP